jgi:hypothetical protein
LGTTITIIYHGWCWFYPIKGCVLPSSLGSHSCPLLLPYCTLQKKINKHSPWVMFYLLEGEYLYKLFRNFCLGKLPILSLLFIYPILYFYQHKLVDIDLVL